MNITKAPSIAASKNYTRRRLNLRLVPEAVVQSRMRPPWSLGLAASFVKAHVSLAWAQMGFPSATNRPSSQGVLLQSNRLL
jgi:hypothetical protein